MKVRPNVYDLMEKIYYIEYKKGKWIADKDSDFIVGIKVKDYMDYGDIIYHLFETNIDINENNVFSTFAIAQFACKVRNEEV